jgi:phospholipid transport system substrate-binding protein
MKIPRCRKRVGVVCTVCLCLYWSAFAIAVSSPKDVVRVGTERLLQMRENSRSGKASDFRQRRGELLSISDEYFNFEEMSKRALGRPWKEQAPDKQREFVRLFKDLLFNAYIDRVEAYKGSAENISYEEEKIDGSYAYVATVVRAPNEAPVDIDYRLGLVNGEWKIYDMVIEGISLVNNYRQQFQSILASGSFDKLLQILGEKAAGRKAS